MRERRYYVYIVANATKILYTGMCNNLHRRVWEHQTKQIEGFTSHFSVCRLVYWESFDDVRDAINREKQIKRWRREKKIWLIERMNRNWKDLSEGWYDSPAGKTRALPLDSPRRGSLGVTGSNSRAKGSRRVK